MKEYREALRESKDLIAMIHVAALPGTPRNELGPGEIVARAVEEARLYRLSGYRTVMIENMHDVPYTRETGPEIPALMAVIGREIKSLGLYCGIQVLAGCNRAALAAAHAAGLDFVRAEGFVFAHVADEGFMDACAGELLRYRRRIGADRVLVFADIKKKHSSHAITADVDIRETAEAASFFLADGIVITGTSTGRPADPSDLEALADFDGLRIVGSGITPDNLAEYFPVADAFIVGSYLKKDGQWFHPPDPDRVRRMIEVFSELAERGTCK